MNEAMRKILKERAKKLAAKGVQKTVLPEGFHAVLFSIEKEIYALETDFVTEVFPLRDFTPLPQVPAHILGAVNVRGRVIPVLNLKNYFGMEEKGLPDLNKLILIQNGSAVLGLLADVILEVRLIPAADLRSPLPTLTGRRSALLKGVTKDGVAFLEGKNILSDKTLTLQETHFSGETQGGTEYELAG